MNWLAFRQFRLQLLTGLAGLVALGIVLLVTGPHLVHLYDTTVVTCAVHRDCASVAANFSAAASWHTVVNDIVLVAPALVGMFWGAPLVARELESRTFQLAWTQSVARARWIATKLVLGGVLSVGAVGLLSLMATWWSSPIDRNMNMPYGTFDQRDIVPLAYAAFAFTLGVAAGAVIRRTLPAMVATLVGFFGVRFAFAQWVHPHLVPSSSSTTPFEGLDALIGRAVRIGPPGTGDFPFSDDVVDPAGRVLGHAQSIGPNGGVGFSYDTDGRVVFQGVGQCPNHFPPRPTAHIGLENQLPNRAVAHAMQTCVNSFHLRDVVTYLPPSRYWTLQWREAAVFVVLAAGLAALSWWWVRTRLR